MNDQITSRWWTLAEIVSVLGLVAWWSVAYVSIADRFEALAEFRRDRTLTLYLTNSRSWLGYALGLGSVAVLLLQRFAPFKVFLASATLSDGTRADPAEPWCPGMAGAKSPRRSPVS